MTKTRPTTSPPTEGAQGSANSKTPLTQTGVPFILEAIPAEAYQEFSHVFIIRDGGALGHSPKMSEATIGYTRYRKQDAEYIASAVNEYPDLSRQLSQSEERVKDWQDDALNKMETLVGYLDYFDKKRPIGGDEIPAVITEVREFITEQRTLLSSSKTN